LQVWQRWQKPVGVAAAVASVLVGDAVSDGKKNRWQEHGR
jgi:hypothetical protein